MKTPWSNLIVQYGTAIAAFLVISLCAVILLAAVGLAVLITKLTVFVR